METEHDVQPDEETQPAGQDAAPSETPDLSEKYPEDQPVTTLDAHDVQSLFQAAYEWLAHNYELVNRLNVFPVPDGDTGTNMLLTIKSAWANIASRDHDTVTRGRQEAKRMRYLAEPGILSRLQGPRR